MKTLIISLLFLAIGLYAGSNFSRMTIEGKTEDVSIKDFKIYGTPGVIYVDAKLENRGLSDNFPDLKISWIGSKIRPEVLVKASEYPHDLQFRKTTRIMFTIDRPADAQQFQLSAFYPS